MERVRPVPAVLYCILVEFLVDRTEIKVEVLIATQGGATTVSTDIRWLLTDILDRRVLTAAIC
jgi:hypothetical protein